MYKILVVLTFIIIPHQVIAQILPKEGSMLPYRLIGFSFKPMLNTNKYIVEIAAGNYNTEDSFKKNIIVSPIGNKNKIITEVPYFGKQYTWRIAYIDRKSNKTKSELHHFSTTFIVDLDTNNTRVRITKNVSKYKDALFFLDGNRALYNMKGHPVWYLPAIDGLNNESLRDVRDMKLSPQGTITFLLNNIPYEINYNGQILWKAPNDGKVSGDSIEHYHHEFTRLSNGNYMALGSEFVKWKLPLTADSNLLRDGKTFYDSISKAYYQKIEFGTIIEYDGNGNVVWSWRSSKYFRESDVQSKINGNLRSRDVHENSFFFDEKAKIIYLSFRNISRILKVHYPDGDIINTYGNKYKAGIAEMKNNLFCNQHSVKHSQKGYLYLFNNNFCNKGAVPKIIMMQEPPAGNSNLKKIWEYECPMEGGVFYTLVPFASGGNVIELPDHAIFASVANDVYSNVFIVSSNKKILWRAIPEKFNQVENKWEPLYQYRASIINSRNELEALVWNGIIKK